MTCWHLIILKNLLNKRNCTMLYLSPRAAVAKYHKLGGLTQQTCLVSQCWTALSLMPRRRNPSCLFLASGVGRPPLAFLGCRCITQAVYGHMTFSLYVLLSSFLCICFCVQISPFYTDTNQV